MKGTLDNGIVFKKSNTEITTYVNANWGRHMVDRRSYTRYVFKMSMGTINCTLQKQRKVALLSTEAEYVTIVEAVKYALYICKFL